MTRTSALHMGFHLCATPALCTCALTHPLTAPALCTCALTHPYPTPAHCTCALTHTLHQRSAHALSPMPPTSALHMRSHTPMTCTSALHVCSRSCLAPELCTFALTHAPHQRSTHALPPMSHTNALHMQCPPLTRPSALHMRSHPCPTPALCTCAPSHVPHQRSAHALSRTHDPHQRSAHALPPIPRTSALHMHSHPCPTPTLCTCNVPP